MTLGYAEGSIAGVALQDANATPCKTLILHAANLKTEFIGEIDYAADSTPIIQILVTTKGVKFGAKLEYAPPGVINDVIAAINAAMISVGSFNVTLQDDLNSINLTAAVDLNSDWVDYPEGRTNPNTVKDTVFQFVTV